jgi:hypothetical protein
MESLLRQVIRKAAQTKRQMSKEERKMEGLHIQKSI